MNAKGRRLSKTRRNKSLEDLVERKSHGNPESHTTSAREEANSATSNTSGLGKRFLKTREESSLTREKFIQKHLISSLEATKPVRRLAFGSKTFEFVEPDHAARGRAQERVARPFIFFS
jgi:hypothetical protein